MPAQEAKGSSLDIGQSTASIFEQNKATSPCFFSISWLLWALFCVYQTVQCPDLTPLATKAGLAPQGSQAVLAFLYPPPVIRSPL